MWRCLDDKGAEHQFCIPNSFFVKSSEPIQLLSPKHWAQTQLKSERGNAQCLTDAHNVVLKWAHDANTLTVPLNAKTNVATLQLAPGYNNYKAFCDAAEIHLHKEDDNPLIADAAYVSDDEDDNSIRSRDLQTFPIGKQSITEDGNAIDWCRPVSTNFHLDGPISEITPEKEDRCGDGETDTVKLLKLHQKFGHISFRRLQVMAKVGIIPKAL